MLQRMRQRRQRGKTIAHFQRAENRARAISKAEAELKRAKELKKEFDIKQKTAKLHRTMEGKKKPSGLVTGLQKVGKWAESRQFAAGDGPFPMSGGPPTRRRKGKKKKRKRREPGPLEMDLDLF